MRATAEAKLAVLADQVGVDLKKTPAEEKQSVLSFFARAWEPFNKKRK